MDAFPHENFSKNPLYSSIPYIMGHNSRGQRDASILWFTASETWVDIYNDQLVNFDSKKDGSYVDFVSESGRLEFFLIGSTSPKLVHQSLAKITGRPLLPPAFSLGYHYSKWDNEISAVKVE
jgi:alpha-glucosidase (family GH31 glycosyl hydrolase)